MSPRLTGTLLCAIALLAALPVSAGAAARFPRVTVEDCTLVDSLSLSSATFEGRMRAIPGTARMWMRFSLQERFGSEGFEAVRVPDLSSWRRSQPGVRIFSYSQRVKALQPGGAYRMRVEFRWYDARGRLLRSVRRNSSPCGRTGPLPDLEIAGVRHRPGASAGTADYWVDVVNTGTAEAEDVPVDLTVDGATLDVREISSLQPGETATVRFSGPPCAHRIHADVDPEDVIHESSEDDNDLVLRCSEIAVEGLVG